jgi:hypothetical protein
MPIRLLLEHDHLFEPEEIDSLIRAFENTLRVLGLTNREDPLTVAVAKLIIQLAKGDERDLAGCETASWRRSDAQFPLQVYVSVGPKPSFGSIHSASYPRRWKPGFFPAVK